MSNLITKLQNLNVVETLHCELITNGAWYEMRRYATPAKRVQDCTEFHRLAISETDADRLQAHWDGFRDCDDIADLFEEDKEHAADLADLAQAWRAELADNVADGNAKAAAQSAAILRDIHAELGPRFNAYTETRDGTEQFIYERISQHLEMADALLIAGDPAADVVYRVLESYRAAYPGLYHAALEAAYEKDMGL